MNTTESRWRIVLCARGEDPREAEQTWACASYWHATRLVRRLADRPRIWPSQYVVPVAHTSSDEHWHRAEAVRLTMWCAIDMTRILQLEYLLGADCPSELFTVPRPAGRCWSCDTAVQRGQYCDACKARRKQVYQTWSKPYRRATRG